MGLLDKAEHSRVKFQIDSEYSNSQSSIVLIKIEVGLAIQ